MRFVDGGGVYVLGVERSVKLDAAVLGREILSKEVDDVRVKYECAVGGRALCGGTVGQRGTQRAFSLDLVSGLEPVFCFALPRAS